jgi:hypothetical protein
MTQIRQGKWVELRHESLEVDGKRFKIVLFTDRKTHFWSSSPR